MEQVIKNLEAIVKHSKELRAKEVGHGITLHLALECLELLKQDNFEDLLQEQLDKCPYEKHVDDGMFNDGFVSGFESGARWCKDNV